MTSYYPITHAECRFDPYSARWVGLDLHEEQILVLEETDLPNPFFSISGGPEHLWRVIK